MGRKIFLIACVQAVPRRRRLAADGDVQLAAYRTSTPRPGAVPWGGGQCPQPHRGTLGKGRRNRNVHSSGQQLPNCVLWECIKGKSRKKSYWQQLGWETSMSLGRWCEGKKGKYCFCKLHETSEGFMVKTQHCIEIKQLHPAAAAVWQHGFI